MVEKPNNYEYNPPQSLGEALQVMKFAHSLHMVLVIGNYTDVFRGIFYGEAGREKVVTWNDLSMGEGTFL